MTSQGTAADDSDAANAEPPSFDTTTAHSARVYDYWLGGKDNYEADREAGDEVIAINPGILHAVRANRAFLRRAVEYLAAQGVRQFLDVGTGLPTAENTHEVAQRVAPDSRIVYVDNDPIVLAHARALLTSTAAGATAYIAADARDPEKILGQAARTLDFSKPVAVILLAVTHFIPDSDDPHRIVSGLVDPLSSGSYLTISAATRDIATDRMTGAAAKYNARRVAAQFIPRTRAEITRFFDGLDLIEPGLVQPQQWRNADVDPDEVISGYAGVGRKL